MTPRAAAAWSSALLAAGGNDPLIVANGGVRNADFGRADLQALAERVSGVSVSAYDGGSELMSILGSQELASARSPQQRWTA